MIRRALAASAVVTASIVAFVAPAEAHVSVAPAEAARGSFTKLTFRVPTESASASTTKIEVVFPDPQTEGLASASVRPKAGWTYAVVKAHLDKPIASDDGDVTDVVSTITWTADAGNGIKPGEFDEFDVSVGPLPTAGTSLVFKVVQTYSDGTVARWIEEASGGSAPEHPAPAVKLVAAAAAPAPASRSATAPAKDDSDRTARALAIVGVGLGAVAFVSSQRRARRP